MYNAPWETSTKYSSQRSPVEGTWYCCMPDASHRRLHELWAAHHIGLHSRNSLLNEVATQWAYFKKHDFKNHVLVETGELISLVSELIRRCIT